MAEIFEINGIIRFIQEDWNRAVYYVEVKNQLIPLVGENRKDIKIGDTVICRGGVEKHKRLMQHIQRYYIRSIQNDNYVVEVVSPYIFEQSAYSLKFKDVLVRQGQAYKKRYYNGLDMLIPIKLYCTLDDGYYKEVEIERNIVNDNVNGVVLNEYKDDEILSTQREYIGTTEIQYLFYIADNLMKGQGK